jgi:hypothetical protein
MALDFDIFAEEFRQWSERFRLEPDLGIAQKYFRYLSRAGITDEKLVEASFEIVATGIHFPTAPEVLAACPQDPLPAIAADTWKPADPHPCDSCGREIIAHAPRCFRCYLKEAGVEGKDADLYERAVEGRVSRGGIDDA